MIVPDACLTLPMSMIKHKWLIKLQVLFTKGDRPLILRLKGDRMRDQLPVHTADVIRADVMTSARIANCPTHSVCAAANVVPIHVSVPFAQIVINLSACAEYSLL